MAMTIDSVWISSSAGGGTSELATRSYCLPRKRHMQSSTLGEPDVQPEMPSGQNLCTVAVAEYTKRNLAVMPPSRVGSGNWQAPYRVTVSMNSQLSETRYCAPGDEHQ
jgi:hypothetical protein